MPRPLEKPRGQERTPACTPCPYLSLGVSLAFTTARGALTLKEAWRPQGPAQSFSALTLRTLGTGEPPVMDSHSKLCGLLTSVPGHSMPVAQHTTGTTETVSRRCHAFPGGTAAVLTVLLSSRQTTTATDLWDSGPHFHNRGTTHRRAPIAPHVPQGFPLFISPWGGPGSQLPVFSRTVTQRAPTTTAAGPTSAHGSVLPQGVAGRAGAHVGALGVAAAEGAEQGVQGALVHVCGGQCRRRLGRVGLWSPRPRPQGRPPSHCPAPGPTGSYPRRSSWGQARSPQRRHIQSLR